jgi:acetoacetyl-CoA reductase/3-oxoacyl-[acyl-carrier protein] reductase
LDLTNRDQIVDAFARITRDLGAVDVLLNNVGQTARERSSEFWCSKPEVWDFVIGVSLKTTMMCSRQVVPAMRERKSGKIVNISSDSAIIGDTLAAEYAAAKAGVIGFTRSLARELASFQINVNAVCPGPINTRAMARIPKDMLDRAVAAVPMGRLGEPQDIADGVTFLASDQARYITGQVLVINGGRVFY